MAYNNLILEREGELAILYINRPKVLNALNQETLREIKAAVTEFAEDRELEVMIITGSGDKSFVAGADIAAMRPLNGNEGRDWAILGHEAFRSIELIQKPVIAAVNGFALGGGCELAMACDLRLASEKAKFGQPEVGLGITPGFGGTQRLPRLVGEGRAKELIYRANIIDAQEAYRIGLVNKVFPAENLLDEARKMAHEIASKAPLAVRYSKACVNRGMQSDIDTGLAIETDLFGLCFASADQEEGMDAFLEKRKADFEAR